MWNYHVITQKCNILKLKMDWKWSGGRRTERGRKHSENERKKEWKAYGPRSRGGIDCFLGLFFCLRCYIIDQTKMWIDYAVTASVIPLLNEFNIWFSLLLHARDSFAVPFGSTVTVNSSSSPSLAGCNIEQHAFKNAVYNNPVLWCCFFFLHCPYVFW